MRYFLLFLRLQSFRIMKAYLLKVMIRTLPLTVSCHFYKTKVTAWKSGRDHETGKASPCHLKFRHIFKPKIINVRGDRTCQFLLIDDLSLSVTFWLMTPAEQPLALTAPLIIMLNLVFAKTQTKIPPFNWF